MQVERMDHHQIVGQSKIFDGQSFAVDQPAAGRFRYLAKNRATRSA